MVASSFCLQHTGAMHALRSDQTLFIPAGGDEGMSLNRKHMICKNSALGIRIEI